MRHVLTSLLTLHWAIAFALLAFICVDGSHGVEVAFAVLGGSADGTQFARLEDVVVAAPLAIAFLLIALLFCWAFVEAFVDDANGMDGASGVIATAFIAASGLLTLLLIGGAAQGIGGLFTAVAMHLAALLASYVAIIAECRLAPEPRASDADPIRSAARAMARGAAHNAMLVRISGRPDASAGRGL